MFSWGCSLSCCDLSHVELMGSCHKSATLSEMKAERSAHTHTHAHTIPFFSFSFFLSHPKCWQDGSRLWSDTSRPESKACGVTESSAEQFYFLSPVSHSFSSRVRRCLRFYIYNGDIRPFALCFICGVTLNGWEQSRSQTFPRWVTRKLTLV